MGLETPGINKYKNENTLKMSYTKPLISHLISHCNYLKFSVVFPTCLILKGEAFSTPFYLLASPLLQVLNIKQKETTSKVW